MGCYRSIFAVSPSSMEGKRARNEVVASEKLKKMVTGLSLMLSIFRKKSWLGRRRRKAEEIDGGLENKSWLLAEAGGGKGDSLEDEEGLNSVHSSFRFSFGSQAEAEEGGLRPGAAAASAAATVLLLVNLEDDGAEFRERQKLGRLESLERSISPVAEMLVRFSFAQIRAATRDFCRGNINYMGLLLLRLVWLQSLRKL